MILVKGHWMSTDGFSLSVLFSSLISISGSTCSKLAELEEHVNPRRSLLSIISSSPADISIILVGYDVDCSIPDLDLSLGTVAGGED